MVCQWDRGPFDPEKPTSPALPATHGWSESQGETVRDLASERPQVEGYAIESELGRGGMGVVYRARQLSLGRVVALKMILGGAHAGPIDRRRFRGEAEAVASLQHPNVVQIFDISESGPIPYLALEYVNGGTLADRLRGVPWPGIEAARLVRTLAGAVSAAHSQGIIHRDLKPANVLISLAGPATEFHADGPGLPPNSTPKVGDFGLAKRLPGDGDPVPNGPTRTGAVMGTPSYLPPEQAAGKNRTVGPAADVYALGAILYELLTGRSPFQGETPLDTIMAVLTEEPVPPRRLNPKAPKDLETVCLKCLEKDPARRYESAAALAEDLGRFLGGLPVRVRPSGVWSRGVKLARRRPTLAALGLTTGVAVLTLLGVSLTFNVALRRAAEREENKAVVAERSRKDADDQRRNAERSRAEAERSRRAAEASARQATEALERSRRGTFALRLAQVANLVEHDPARAAEILDDVERCPPDLRDFAWGHLRARSRREVRSFAAHSEPISAVAVSPNGRRIATASWDGTARVFDRKTGTVVATLRGHPGLVLDVAFSPDGKTVATAGDDRRVRLWRYSAGQGLAEPRPWAELVGHDGAVRCVAFAPDGGSLATGSADGTVKVWVPDEGPGKYRISVTLNRHRGAVWSLGFSPDGTTLASAGDDGIVRIWDRTRPGDQPREMGPHPGPVIDVDFSHDGRRLAAVCYADGHAVHVWDVARATEKVVLRGHAGPVYAVAFGPDSDALATAGGDGTLRLWDSDSGRARCVLPGHDGAVRDLRFLPGGDEIVSCGVDATVRIWSVGSRGNDVASWPAGAGVVRAAISSDGRTTAAGRSDGKLCLRFDDGHVVEWDGHLGQVTALAFSPDGSRLASAAGDGVVHVWKVDSATRGRSLASVRLVGLTGGVQAVAWSPDGGRLVAAGEQGVRIWEADGSVVIDGSARPVGTVAGLAVSTDGHHLAVAAGRTIQVFEIADVGIVRVASAEREASTSAVAFSPDGRSIAFGDESGVVSLSGFEPGVPTLDERFRMPGHRGAVRDITFGADGTTLATAGSDRSVRWWDAVAGLERASLEGHLDAVLAVRIPAEGGAISLLSAGKDGEVRRWFADRH